MRQILKSGHHKQALAKMDETISFGECELRHAWGYALANKGHDTRAIQGWLGHRSIIHGGLHRAGAQQVQGLLAGLAKALKIGRVSVYRVLWTSSAEPVRPMSAQEPR
jgi:hypothetical protein